MPHLPSPATDLLVQHIAADRIQAATASASPPPLPPPLVAPSLSPRAEESEPRGLAWAIAQDRISGMVGTEGEHEHDVLLKELARKLDEERAAGAGTITASPARESARDRVK